MNLLIKIITFNCFRRRCMSFVSLSDLSSYLFAALLGFLCNHRLFEKAKIVEKMGFVLGIQNTSWKGTIKNFCHLSSTSSGGLLSEGILCNRSCKAAWTYSVTNVMEGRYTYQGQHRLTTVSFSFVRESSLLMEIC